jgi:hypothetical protein
MLPSVTPPADCVGCSTGKATKSYCLIIEPQQHSWANHQLCCAHMSMTECYIA